MARSVKDASDPVLPSYQLQRADVARCGSFTYAESPLELPHLRHKLAHVGHVPHGVTCVTTEFLKSYKKVVKGPRLAFLESE